MASYLSNIVKTATLPVTSLNASILNQARNVINSVRFFAVAAAKKRITAAKGRTALTSGKKKASAKKKTASKATTAKKADKSKKDAKEKALKEKEKLKAKKEKEREAKSAEEEKAKKQLQAQKEKAKKEKEVEKEKLARQKEKERERARKAKALENEKKEKLKLKKAQIKAEKEKKPKRLPSAYSLFYQAQFQAQKPKGGRDALVSFAKTVGEKWRALDEATKQQYNDQIAKLRPAYEEARRKYLAEKKASKKLSPYNKFIQQHFPKVKEVNPSKSTTEILKLVVNKWRELPAAEKQRLLKQ